MGVTITRRRNLFRAPYGDRLRPEDGTLHRSLRGGNAQLELALIELVNDLAHRGLIQVGRHSKGSLHLDGGGYGRDRRRHGDKCRPRPSRAGGCRQANPHGKLFHAFMLTRAGCFCKQPRLQGEGKIREGESRQAEEKEESDHISDGGQHDGGSEGGVDAQGLQPERN